MVYIIKKFNITKIFQKLKYLVNFFGLINNKRIKYVHVHIYILIIHIIKIKLITDKIFH